MQKTYRMKVPDDTKSVGIGKSEPFSWLDTKVSAVHHQRSWTHFGRATKPCKFSRSACWVNFRVQYHPYLVCAR